jgi:hypothetical protein
MLLVHCELIDQHHSLVADAVEVFFAMEPLYPLPDLVWRAAGKIGLLTARSST